MSKKEMNDNSAMQSALQPTAAYGNKCGLTKTELEEYIGDVTLKLVISGKGGHLTEGKSPRILWKTNFSVLCDFLKKKRMQYAIDLPVVNTKDWIKGNATDATLLLQRLAHSNIASSYCEDPDLLQVRGKLIEMFPDNALGVNIFWQHHVEGTDIKEIAKQEGLTKDQVVYQVRKTKKIFRAKMRSRFIACEMLGI